MLGTPKHSLFDLLLVRYQFDCPARQGGKELREQSKELGLSFSYWHR